MAHLTRHAPFDVADPVESSDSPDHIFRSFFQPVNAGKTRPRLRMDVGETAEHYTVLVDMPGVNKNEIQVSIDGNTVSIGADVKRQLGQTEGADMLQRERHSGRLSRSFALEHELDDAACSAHYQDGVLELVLPKKTATAAKQLTIQ